MVCGEGLSPYSKAFQTETRAMGFGWSKVSRQTQTNFCLSNFLQEAKPVFSVFFSGLSLAVISYAVLNQQLSFLFLTRVHQP
jgi:hypothetical protein